MLNDVTETEVPFAKKIADQPFLITEDDINKLRILLCGSHIVAVLGLGVCRIPPFGERYLGGGMG